MSTKCHILADGRMIVVKGTATPVAHEFSALPRVGEKIVILNDRGEAEAFQVTEIKHYAHGVDGAATVLVSASSSR
jgi:hypothetical protein